MSQRTRARLCQIAIMALACAILALLIGCASGRSSLGVSLGFHLGSPPAVEEPEPPTTEPSEPTP